jgi:hypothetical protein
MKETEEEEDPFLGRFRRLAVPMSEAGMLSAFKVALYALLNYAMLTRTLGHLSWSQGDMRGAVRGSALQRAWPRKAQTYYRYGMLTLSKKRTVYYHTKLSGTTTLGHGREVLQRSCSPVIEPFLLHGFVCKSSHMSLSH